MSPPGNTDVSSSLSKLSLDPNKATPKAKPGKKSKKKVVADSWEDEDLSESEPEPKKASADELSSSSSSEEKTPARELPAMSTPPGDDTWSSPSSDISSARQVDPDKRPEKTDAVARRMIAAGLGLKVPRLTEEQRAYQKSVKEQEKKKRELEKAAEQKRKDDAEKAKAAIWDD